MLVHSALNATLGKVWPYRTAVVQDRLLTVSMRGTDNSHEESYRRLKELLGNKWDNHICFELVNGDKSLYCQWSDWVLYVGLTIVESGK